MKKIISIFFLFIINEQLSAQQFNVAFSEQQEPFRTPGNYALAGGGFIGVKYEKNAASVGWKKRREEISILLYDDSMKLLKENKMGNGESAFGAVYTAFKKINNRFWLIYTEGGEGNILGDFKAAEINPVTLETKPKTIAASAELELKLSYALTGSTIEFKTSPNGKYSCLFMTTDKKEAYLCSLDEELNTVWSTRATEKDIDGNPDDIKSVEVDDKGTIYLGYTKDGLGHIAVYKNRTPQILDVKLDVGKPNEVLILAHKNNASLTIAGGYFENTGDVRGVFKASMDASLKISEITKTPFSDSLVKQFDKDGWGHTRANKYGIIPAYIAQLVEVDDHADDLVIEIKQEIISEKLGTIVHSGNILNVYFNKDKASFTRIPKYNVAVGTLWAHYYAAPFQNKMIIFYNDNPVNLERDINASPKLVDIEDNSVLVAAVIEPDGSMKRRLPLELKQNYLATAEWLHPVAPNNLQVPLYIKKKLSYATISVE